MKFLINNYHSESQTECLYFNTVINLIKGCSSTIWDPRQCSAYDIFDLTKPDYFLTHIASIKEDVLRYMREHVGCKMIINITGANQENVEQIEKFILDHNVDIAFFFTNHDETYKLRHTNVVSIPLGADIFLNQHPLRYQLDKAIIVNSKSEIIQSEGSYHILSYNKKLEKDVDIVMPSNHLAGLYRNYNEIVLRFYGTLLPQIFFDAIYYGNKVYYDFEDKEQLSSINAKINKVLKLKGDEDSDTIKNIVKKKHTCLNRVKSLLSQLPSNHIIGQIDDIMSTLIGEVK
jgi:hypothetical protein